MSVYELPLQDCEFFTSDDSVVKVSPTLPHALLLSYANWFCHFRWIINGILFAFGISSFFPDVMLSVGFHNSSSWAFVTAIVLTVLNIFYLQHISMLRRSPNSVHLGRNIQVQVFLDILALTAVVHFLGSLETYAPFAYLFHIVLGCIIFSSVKSLGITLYACGLFTLLVLSEEYGIIKRAGIFSDMSVRDSIAGSGFGPALNVMSIFGICLVVWYLASHLSQMVRERDLDLEITNHRLMESQREKTRHMLRTTHELKAPFAAIHANVQLLLKGHCGELTDSATEVLGRISVRCRRLTTEIQDMLQLSNLKSSETKEMEMISFELSDILQWNISQLKPLAEEHNVSLDVDLTPVRIDAVEDFIKMLFLNIMTNAVIYSHPGGVVKVRSYLDGSSSPVVVIEDKGIGIHSDKLPRIFEEYFRTEEAASYNKSSSGLGLAIVRHVAFIHCIKVRIESAPDEGTKFTLQFP